MHKRFLSLLFIFCLYSLVSAQGLETMCPIGLQQGSPGADISFVLSATDYSFFINKATRFSNSIQIIDANQPWPPRWFSIVPFDTTLGMPFSALIPLNASYQNEKFSFFSIIKTKEKNQQEHYRHGFIICNPNLEAIDTFILPGEDLDHHDFRIEKNGELLFFVLHDTIMDMSTVHHNTHDTALNLSYEIIEIRDSTGKPCFRWDPMEHLGPAAQYPRYWIAKGIWTRHDIFDWSHGNSICFDYDGDILYSYKFIGIGKISRKDGHIIWKIDRGQQQPNLYSDTIPIFMQHDFKAEKDAAGHTFYTVFSNGDGQHHLCSAFQFTVADTINGQKAFKIKKWFKPEERIPNTSGGGNYDVEADGHYIVNYGTFKADTSLPRTFFEYRNADDKLEARYTIYPFALSYRVHKLNNWRPERPVAKQKGKTLYLKSSSTEIIWYELNQETQQATQVGSGDRFSPKQSGVYCATVKYGCGFAVSYPIKYIK